MKKLLIIALIFPILSCGVKKELSSAQKENAELETQIFESKKKIKELETKYYKASNRVRRLEYENEQKDNTINRLQNKVDELSGENRIHVDEDGASSMFYQSTTKTVKKEGKIYEFVKERPQFPGGNDALDKFIKNNLRYPVIAKENRIEGKVYVSFVVEKDGKLTDIKVMRGLGNGCDEEAIRTINLMPKWTPGKQEGKNVRVRYVLPISFKLID